MADLSKAPEQPTQSQRIQAAGKVVNIDLSKPIDCSLMNLVQASVDPVQEDCTGRLYFLRRVKLFAYVFNEQGEREELRIDFTLKSNRAPKI